MSLPEFTADVSLYRSSGHYTGFSTRIGGVGALSAALNIGRPIALPFPIFPIFTCSGSQAACLSGSYSDCEAYYDNCFGGFNPCGQAYADCIQGSFASCIFHSNYCEGTGPDPTGGPAQ